MLLIWLLSCLLQLSIYSAKLFQPYTLENCPALTVVAAVHLLGTYWGRYADLVVIVNRRGVKL